MLRPQQLNAPVAGLILTGVLDRYPKLKLVMAESRIAWVLDVLWTCHLIEVVRPGDPHGSLKRTHTASCCAAPKRASTGDQKNPVGSRRRT